MKKIIIALTAFFTLASTTAHAQTVSEEFSPYWYIQGQGGVQLPFTPGKRSELLSPAFGLNLGRVVSPYVALRVGIEGWKSKVQSLTVKDTYNSFKYATGSFDAMLNVSNLFCTKKVHPVNFYVLGGAGLNWSEAVPESSSKFSPNIRVGALLDARVSKAVSLSLEYRCDNTTNEFNGRLSDSHDWYSSLYLGVAVNFGYKKKTKPIEPEPEPIPVPEEKPEPVIESITVTEPAPKKLEKMTENIFFVINKTQADKAESAKIDAAAEWLKSHPTATVTVTGYADAGTGNATINKRIADKRAAEVAARLKAAGIAESRITVDSKGDTVQPFAENAKNRVAIVFAEEK